MFCSFHHNQEYRPEQKANNLPLQFLFLFSIVYVRDFTARDLSMTTIIYKHEGYKWTILLYASFHAKYESLIEKQLITILNDVIVLARFPQLSTPLSLLGNQNLVDFNLV